MPRASIMNYHYKKISQAAKYILSIERQFELHENNFDGISNSQSSIRKPILDVISKYRAGAQKTSHLLLKNVSTLNLMLNIATTAIVGSGLFGSWVASAIIRKMHIFASTSPFNSSGEMDRKWSLTIASCGAYFILKFRNIFSSIMSGNALNLILGGNDIGVMLSFFAFSFFVDPTVGGLIGCSYVSLEALTSLMSNGADSFFSGVMAFRLVPLDADGNAGKPNVKCNQITNSSIVKEALQTTLSSASLLASMPKYFLSVYLVASTLLRFIEKYDKKLFGNTLSWFRVGVNDKESFLKTNLSLQLLILHFVVTAFKGLIAFFLV